MDKISNLNVREKLTEIVEKYPGRVALSAAAIVTAVALLITFISGKGKDSPSEVAESPQQIVELVDQQPEEYFINVEKEPGFHSSEWDITIDAGTRITTEPRRDSGYVGTVRASEDAKLLMLDGDYALVLYNVPQEKYDYDLNHDHRRIGYVPIDTVHSNREDGRLFEPLSKDTRYVKFDRAARIRNRMYDDDGGGILTTSRPGDYARVVGSVLTPEWDDTEIYVVAYNSPKGTFLGFMEGRNGTFISEQEMIDVINTEYSYLNITGTDVNLRRTPTTNENNVITRLNKGASGILLEDSPPGWYHFVGEGCDGYISQTVNCIQIVKEKRVPSGIEGLHFDEHNDDLVL